MKPLRQRLADRELTIGSWLSFGYTPICEMMARAGFDWLVIDMEHTAIDIWQAQQLIQVIDLAGCVPLVRVGANDPLLIKRVLDAGAHGIIVPLVNSRGEAERAVASARYPPLGARGVGLSRAQAYGLEFDAYKTWADRETIVIVQIEHHLGVSGLNEILQVEGVDGCFAGQYDLSGSLGLPGALDDPSVVSAMKRAEAFIEEGHLFGYHVCHPDRDALLRKITRGYKFIAYGGDMHFLASKLSDETQFLQQHTARGSP